MARLGALAAGPVLALGLAGRRPMALALLALPLLYWQWVAPIRDVSEAAGDPSVHSSYYQPLLAQLQRRTRGPPGASRDPAHPQSLGGQLRGAALPARPRLAAPARVRRRRPVTNGNLTATAYRSWLDDRGVSYVAVSDTTLDYLSTDEEALIRGGLPYLRPVWSNQHWRLYRVEHSTGLVSARR